MLIDRSPDRRAAALAATLSLALVLVGAPAARADGDAADDAAGAAPPRPTRGHLVRHAVLLGGGLLAYALSEAAFKADLAPAACRWCEPLAFDRAVRDAVHWGGTGAPDAASYATLALELGPAALVVGARWGADRDGALDDALAIGEAAVVTGLVDQAVKFAAGRERPFVHFAAAGRVHQTDDDLSFFSGHASIAFALATAAGTVADRRHLRAAPWVWGAGLTLAGATAYLRMAADKHYLSDVAVGAVAGAALGAYLPRWAHDHGDLAIVPAPGGLAVVGSF